MLTTNLGWSFEMYGLFYQQLHLKIYIFLMLESKIQKSTRSLIRRPGVYSAFKYMYSLLNLLTAAGEYDRNNVFIEHQCM